MRNGGTRIAEMNELKRAEEARLEVLREYQVLDTPPEQGFEDVTELASFICGTPISLVTLVDADRQWFKSERGFGKRETPRTQSFCAHTIGTGEMLVVENALKDARFSDNPFVAGEPGVRFYAGAPLIDGTGHILGTVCVVDTVPRSLGPSQKAALEALARQVMSLLEQRRTIAEQAVREREMQEVAARFELAVEAAEIGIFSWEAEGDRARWENDQMYRILVRPPEQGPVSAAEFAAGIVFPEHARSYLAALEQTMRTGEPFSWQGKFRRGDGRHAWLELTARVERGTDGIPARLLGAALDITARRETELALRGSEERLQLAQQSARIATWDWDIATGRFLWAGDSQWVYGRPPEEMGHVDRILPIIHEEDLPVVREALEPALRGTGEYHATFRVYWPDGSTHWVAGHAAPVLTPEGKVARLVGINMNVTEQRRTEAALRQSEKLAAVGRLASTIAHEMNNPLESVMNLVYLAAESEGLPAEAGAYLQTAERELRRVAAITSQTLRFHKQATNPRAVSAESLIEGALSIYQGRLVNAGITVERRARKAEPVLCFDGEVRQVLNNLLGNAIDAMPGGGRLVLRSRQTAQGASGRAGLTLTVADTGSGMSEATQRRLFDAFFSTKGVGGTGLGLWVSKEIVERHRGNLRVRSREGAGTVFTLFLPYDAVSR